MSSEAADTSKAKDGGNNNKDGGERRQRKQIFDLGVLSDKEIVVKFSGGRQVRGVLKGYDPLFNVVLDNAVETLRSADDPYTASDRTRKLGLVVCRGTALMTVGPADGMHEIDNPFSEAAQQAEQPLI